jgi:uncharacterized protein YidB (DUF937 family)
MGIIETMFGALSGSDAATHPWLLQAMRALEDPAQGGIGLSGLLRRLEAAGLERQVQSWIQPGRNLPLNPADLQRALGPDLVRGMAFRAGLTPEELVSKLSGHLPGVVDRLTREGKSPLSNSD